MELIAIHSHLLRLRMTVMIWQRLERSVYT